MQARRFDLADLLTASGAAMAASNQRLAEAGAPALLKEFKLHLDFEATLCLDDAAAIVFRRVSKPNPQLRALLKQRAANVTIEATYMAAPSLVSAPDAGRGADP